jgi:hypothetical protein
MIRFIDPRGETGLVEQAYGLRLRKGPAVVALLSNLYPDASRFLAHVGDALVATAPELSVRMYEKPGPAGQVSDELMEVMLEEANAVIAAYGH